MSESDDTDFLLLIPPDYYNSKALEEFDNFEIRKQLTGQKQLEDPLSAIIDEVSDQVYRIHNTMNTANNPMLPRASLSEASNTAAGSYPYLPPTKKAELNDINTRLQILEMGGGNAGDGGNAYTFAAPSDISTISNCTVLTQFAHNRLSRDTLRLVHSTPKCSQPQHKHAEECNGNVMRNYQVDADKDGVLYEIDDFFDDRGLHRNQPQHCNDDWDYHHHYSDDYRLHAAPDKMGNMQIGQAASMPDALDCISDKSKHGQQQSQLNVPPMPTAYKNADDNLISLSEIWGRSGHGTAIAGPSPTALKEEQLRRQHLEKTVHSLQSRLLEYQQRLSVAIEVDRAKDAALANANAECRSFKSEVQHLRESLLKSESEQKDFHTKMDGLQKELAHAVSLATKFQEKNEKLEAELMASSRKTNECNNLYKQQVEDLEIKMNACKRSEEFAINELNKFKDKLAKAEYQSEKLKVRGEELEKECSTLKHQKEMLQEFHQKQKSRADSLETQRKSLQESIGTLTENETTLKRKLDLQQKSLKSHYQQQLENVVAQKLREFQEQLDRTEEHLKGESRERERLLADRAVKQLELINEKNELELNLMQEKHMEEVELYRIQLANASKKIQDLEEKLSGYKSKRADIAEKLHNVMETQWQKALEILTSPNNPARQLNDANYTESPDDNSNQKQNRNNENGDENDNNAQHFETPKSSKTKKSKENNFNVTNNKNRTSPEPMDRLQAYIELLLSKSPSDIDKLDEILALSTKSKATAGKLDKTLKRSSGKPPWKA